MLAAPPTRRPSASLAGRCATRAGGKASSRCTQDWPPRDPRLDQRRRRTSGAHPDESPRNPDPSYRRSRMIELAVSETTVLIIASAAGAFAFVLQPLLLSWCSPSCSEPEEDCVDDVQRASSS